MDTGAWIGLVVGVVGVLLGLAIAGVLAWRGMLTFRALRRGGRVLHDPQAQIVDIPVWRISRVPRGTPYVNMGRIPLVPTLAWRSGGDPLFRIRPDGIEYRIVRRKTLAFEEIETVDAPPVGRPFLTIRIRGGMLDLSILVASEDAFRHALAQLARTCPVTDRARARIDAPAPAASSRPVANTSRAKSSR